MRQLELITSHTPEIQKDCFLLSVANVKGILGFSVPSITLAALLGNISLLVICAFLSTLFWSFLFLFFFFSRIKQCLPPALDKKSTHHRDFLRYSWAVQSHSRFCFCGPSWASALHCDLHKLRTHSNDWRNRKTHSKFVNAQRDPTNLATTKHGGD